MGDGYESTISFKQYIMGKLLAATDNIANKLSEKILKLVDGSIDNPQKFPLQITVNQIGESLLCQRVLDSLSDKLENNGIIIVAVNEDGIVVDINDIPEEKIEEEQCLIGIPSVEKAVLISGDNKSLKFTRIYDWAAKQIILEAESGGFSTVISFIGDPVNKDPIIMKRLIRNLVALGYKVENDNKIVDPGSRPDYSKIKTITVSWGVQ